MARRLKLDDVISIHALREEGDQRKQRGLPQSIRFQSTPSARRATACGGVDDRRRNISIHALREEGDGHGPPPQAG